MPDRSQGRRRGERGFALVLAILSLMLLTFLGLTLATTTSTELQIATNYRWSQQALYNAEAGLEAARIVLSTIADDVVYWRDFLPAYRPGPWPQGAAPAHEAPVATRDFDKDACDNRGGVGYGRVIVEPGGAPAYENVSTFPLAGGAGSQTLNGAFTVWIRRPLVVNNDGTYSDEDDNDRVVIVAEGVAPYGGPGDAFTRARQATRVLETRFTLALGEVGDPCLGNQQGQEGGSPMGENFSPCAPITAGRGKTLEDAFGGAASGNLTGTGVR
jgi:hypothetical protein